MNIFENHVIPVGVHASFVVGDKTYQKFEYCNIGNYPLGEIPEIG
jgi:hypothetical protein